MTTLAKCFGALVASGNGFQCDNLRVLLRQNLLLTDRFTGQSRVWLHKFGRKQFPNSHRLLRTEIAEEIDILYEDVPTVLLQKRMDHGAVFTHDPVWQKEIESWHFSDILEDAMRKGKWNGTVGSS